MECNGQRAHWVWGLCWRPLLTGNTHPQTGGEGSLSQPPPLPTITSSYGRQDALPVTLRPDAGPQACARDTSWPRGDAPGALPPPRRILHEALAGT